jgi:hypothetical protein
MLRHIARMLAVALLIACGGGSDPAGPGETVVGEYTLRTINGTALPVVIGREQGVTVSALSGTMSLRADRTFSASVTARGVSAGSDVTSTFTSVGTYTVNGSALTLLATGTENARLTGSYANGRVTMTEDGFVSVYTR